MSEENTGRTRAQDDAVKKAWDILSEHFERVLLVVDTESGDDGDAHQVFWHGGFISGIGCAEYAKHHMLHSQSMGESEP